MEPVVRGRPFRISPKKEMKIGAGSLGSSVRPVDGGYEGGEQRDVRPSQAATRWSRPEPPSIGTRAIIRPSARASQSGRAAVRPEYACRLVQSMYRRQEIMRVPVDGGSA